MVASPRAWGRRCGKAPSTTVTPASSGSLMDYALPKADMLPMYETDRTETPTPVNPLGIKGAGETGTIASTPAVVNAVVDALSGFGVDHIETMPLTPERVWKTIQAAKSKK